MRIVRPSFAAAAALAVAAFFSADAGAQVQTTGTARIEQGASSDVIQNVLSNMNVTVTVIDHQGSAAAGPRTSSIDSVGQNIELGTMQTLFTSGGLISQEAVSVSVGAMADEDQSASGCTAAGCEGVVVVLAQYN